MHAIKAHNKYMYTLIIIKIFLLFSSLSIRMSGNSINFNDKKIKKKLQQNQKYI